MGQKPTWVQLTVRLLLRLLFRVTLQGPPIHFGQGRLLLIPNHQSFVDGILLGAFLPRIPTFVVHTTVMKAWYFNFGMRFLPHVVVDSTNPLAMKTVVQLIESNIPVVIFPEGRITQTGALMKIYEGPAFIAARTGAEVVPIIITGGLRSMFSRMPSWYRREWFPRMTVTLHPGAPIPMPEGRSAKLRRKAAADLMRRRMQEALFATRPRRTIPEAFLDTMEDEGPKRVILEDVRDTPESYSQILKAALALGRLASRLSSDREVVGVLMPNVGTNLALIMGLMMNRRVPAMLNYTAGSEGMQSACEIAKIKTILTSRKFLESGKFADAVAKLKGVQVVCLEDLRPQFTLGDKLWLVLSALRQPRRAMAKITEDDPAVVLFTSGSEGKPKGVVLSHKAILANVYQARTVIEFNSNDKVLNALPMFHSFGLTAGTFLPLLTGAKLVMYVSPLHYRIVPELAYDRDCTTMFGTGTFLLNYAKAANPYDFYRMKFVVAGAEKLSDETRQIWFEKFGIRLLEGYGATECAPVIAVNTFMAYRTGSVGQILPGMEHRLVPVEGIDQGGTLHVRGDNLMLGYLLHDQPGILRPPQSDLGPGWYDTGDIVDVDADGYVHIMGRMKRFAKVAGEMVSLEVVEKIAAIASPKHQSAASTQTDGHRGELIVLFTDDPQLKREHLQAAARQSGQPEIAIPRKVYMVEKLPLLGSGKRDYVTIKKMADERQDAQVQTR